MKACVLHGIGDLRLEEVKDSVPGRGEVLIKIKASGICGSDIPRVFTKGTYHFPTIPGHEFSGVIVERGEDVEPSLVGRKAAVFPLIPCRRCGACQVGEYAQCKDYNYFGSRCDGGFAEYIAVPVWNAVLVPDNLSYEEAAMAEPAAVAVHALRQVGIEIGDYVAVFGAGPIGLILGQWARAWGAHEVIMIDIDEQKIAFAEKQGFCHGIDSSKTDPVEYINAITHGRGVDVAVEGTGVGAALERCLYSVRPFGRLVAMGNPAGDIHLSQRGYWELLRKQITIKGTWNSNFATFPKDDWQLAINAMESGQLRVGSLITHRISIDQVWDTLNMMKDKKAFYNKVMITFD
jgi:L-iditol 2-dehydrogenase